MKPLIISSVFFIISFVLFSTCSKEGNPNEPNVVENTTTITKSDIKINLESLAKKIQPVGKIIDYKIVIENGKEKKVPIYDGDPDREVGITALPCDYYSNYGVNFDHYETKSGKFIGICNQSSELKSANELHGTWGFNGYFAYSETEKNNLVNIGYNSTNIMVGVSLSNGQYTIPSGTFSKYYIDEPFEKRSIAWGNAVNLANSIYSINSGAELFMSSYKDDNLTYS